MFVMTETESAEMFDDPASCHSHHQVAISTNANFDNASCRVGLGDMAKNIMIKILVNWSANRSQCRFRVGIFSSDTEESWNISLEVIKLNKKPAARRIGNFLNCLTNKLIVYAHLMAVSLE